MSKRQGKQAGIPPDPETLAEVYQLLLQQVTVGIFITNQEGYLLEVNPQGCQIVGYIFEELKHLSWQDLLVSETSAPDPLSPDNLAVGETVSSKGHLRRKDNQLILVNIKARKLNNGNMLWIVHNMNVSHYPGETLRERIERDKQLTKMVTTAPGIINLYQFAADGTVTYPYASPAIQDIFGLTPEDLAKDASPVMALIHPDDVTRVQESIADSARTLLPWQDQYRVRHPVKGEIWVEAHSTPELQPDDSVLWYGFLQDITERKKAEKAEKASQAQLSLLTDALPVLISYVDADQRYQFINKGYEDWFGFKRDELKGQRLEQVLDTLAYQIVSPYVERALAGETVTYETIIPLKDQTRYAHVIYVPDITEKGQVKGFFTLVTDITLYKQAEEGLQANQARLTGIIESAMDAIVSVDADQRIVLFNEAAEQVFGCSSAEAIGQPLDIFIPERFRQAHREQIQTFSQTGITNRAKGTGKVMFGRRRNGEEFPIEASISQIEVAGAKLFTVILRDVTEHMKAEEQLFYQANLLQNVSDAIIAADMHLKINSWNHAAEMIYGWSVDEVLGLGMNELLGTKHMDEDTDYVLHQFLDEASWEGEVVQKHKDGSILYVLSSVSIIKDANNNLAGVVAVNRDITEQKEAEKVHMLLQSQLQQAQKMESIGQLAGGVAHDFNNMLTVIQMYSELIRAKLPADHPLIEKIDLIRGASQRSSMLTRQLLAFSRRQILSPKTLDLNNVIADLLKMLERLIGEDIILSSVFQPGLWSITADSSQIEQVVMNLVINARDAMPKGGMLTIETRNIQLDETYSKTHIGAPPGPFVLLTITDTGQGMDKQTQTRIFEPFFTTKKQGKGTGLGLSTVHGIVKQSGGNISVYSELDKGTTFKVYLPANVDGFDSSDKTQTQVVSSGNGETILLVEDEEMVRELVQSALRDLGYTVLVAHNGEAALSLVNHYLDPIDLVLTDVIMPRKSGRELVETLLVLRPEIKVLFMSGYTDDAVIRHGLLMGEIEFLQKPFSQLDLAAKVHQVLDKTVDAK
jgi:PAS domain S-box-containing protein